MYRITPAWYILSYLHLIPKPQAVPNHAGQNHVKSPRPKLYKSALDLGSMGLACAIFGFLFLILCQDIYSILFNYDSWSEYFVNNNKIISLLILLKPLAIIIKNCLAVLLFAYKPSRLRVFIHDIRKIISGLMITEKEKRRHGIIFLVCFCIACIIGMARLSAICLYWMLFKNPFRSYPYEQWGVSRNIIIVTNGSAEIIGDILSLSVYIQIAAFANVMVNCCRNINSKISLLKDSLSLDDEGSKNTATFREHIIGLRQSYEALTHVYNSYERHFSLQIVFGVLNNGFTIFASIASFFRMGEPRFWYIGNALSCAMCLFVIWILAHFPIHLHEESSETAELLQEVIYEYQTAYLAVPTAIPPDQSPTWPKDSLLLYGFLQRTVTNPLLVTAGGFVELTRSFIISITALIVGFTLFLLEQYEGHRPPVTCQILNGTAKSMGTIE